MQTGGGIAPDCIRATSGPGSQRDRAKKHQLRSALAPPGLVAFSRILSTVLSPDSVHDAR